MQQLKIFSDKEVFTLKRPTITTAQKLVLIERWSNDAEAKGYTNLIYESDEDIEELQKIFWPVFDMSEWAIQCHLEQFFNLPKEFEDDDAEWHDEKTEEWEEWESFRSDIDLDINEETRKNIEEWVNVHDLKLTLKCGDKLGNKIIKTRIDSLYKYTYEESGKTGIRNLNGEDI